MRVIAGELKRRRLAAPRGLATRPSSDRLRQALFDVLGATLAHLGIANTIVARPLPAALARLAGPWDLIFADPPYAALPQSFADLEPFARAALRPGGRFLFEARATPLHDPWAGMPLLRRLE